MDPSVDIVGGWVPLATVDVSVVVVDWAIPVVVDMSVDVGWVPPAVVVISVDDVG